MAGGTQAENSAKDGQNGALCILAAMPSPKGLAKSFQGNTFVQYFNITHNNCNLLNF